MKHKWYDAIVAKAGDMDLVVFARKAYGGDWAEVDSKENIPTFNQDNEYFLCLPQHKEACLHWLNGGLTEVKSSLTDGDWSECVNPSTPFWKDGIGWMRKDAHYRVKVRKEKRWIGYCANTNQTFPHPQKTIEIAEGYAARNYGYKMSDWQFIEIEIEV